MITKVRVTKLTIDDKLSYISRIYEIGDEEFQEFGLVISRSGDFGANTTRR